MVTPTVTLRARERAAHYEQKAAQYKAEGSRIKALREAAWYHQEIAEGAQWDGMTLVLFRRLKRAGIRSVGALAALSDEEVMKLRGCGRVSLAEIRVFLTHREPLEAP